MILSSRIIAAAAIGAAAAQAHAHTGPRVWIGNENGTLVTYASDNDLAPTSYSPYKLFLGGIDEDTLAANGRMDPFPVPGTGVFATEFPGYQVRLDRAGDSAAGGLSFGTTVGFKTAGPLIVFDPATGYYRTTQQAFGDPGPAPQFGLSVQGGSSPTVVTAAGPVNGVNFYNYNGATDHGHLLTTMLPEGEIPPGGEPPGDGPHAVYALPLRLTAAGYSDSLPYVILFGRGVGYPDDQDFVDALDVAQTSYGLPGDANLDGTVDVADLGILATHWQQTGFWTDGDFTNDGAIDVADLGILATNWQAGVQSFQIALDSTGWAIVNLPEPHSPVMMLLISSLALSARHRRRTLASHPNLTCHQRSRSIDFPQCGQVRAAF